MGRILAEMDSQEITEWMALDSHIAPIGDRRQDYNAAAIQMQIAAAAGVQKKLSDFLLWDRPRGRQMTSQEISEMCRSLWGG